MNREELIARMTNTINNVNEDGLKLITPMLGMENIERYSIETSPERREELDQIRMAETQAREFERKRNDLFERKLRRDKQIELMSGKEKIFWDKIQKTKEIEEIILYDLSVLQLNFLAELHENSLIDGSSDIFHYGFYQGIQYMKNQAKRSVEHGS